MLSAFINVWMQASTGRLCKKCPHFGYTPWGAKVFDRILCTANVLSRSARLEPDATSSARRKKECVNPNRDFRKSGVLIWVLVTSQHLHVLNPECKTIGVPTVLGDISRTVSLRVQGPK